MCNLEKLMRKIEERKFCKCAFQKSKKKSYSLPKQVLFG